MLARHVRVKKKRKTERRKRRDIQAINIILDVQLVP